MVTTAFARWPDTRTRLEDKEFKQLSNHSFTCKLEKLKESVNVE